MTARDCKRMVSKHYLNLIFFSEFSRYSRVKRRISERYSSMTPFPVKDTENLVCKPSILETYREGLPFDVDFRYTRPCAGSTPLTCSTCSEPPIDNSMPVPKWYRSMEPNKLNKLHVCQLHITRMWQKQYYVEAHATSPPPPFLPLTP